MICSNVTWQLEPTTAGKLTLTLDGKSYIAFVKMCLCTSKEKLWKSRCFVQFFLMPLTCKNAFYYGYVRLTLGPTIPLECHMWMGNTQVLMPPPAASHTLVGSWIKRVE